MVTSTVCLILFLCIMLWLNVFVVKFIHRVHVYYTSSLIFYMLVQLHQCNWTKQLQSLEAYSNKMVKDHIRMTLFGRAPCLAILANLDPASGVHCFIIFSPKSESLAIFTARVDILHSVVSLKFSSMTALMDFLPCQSSINAEGIALFPADLLTMGSGGRWCEGSVGCVGPGRTDSLSATWLW